MKHALRFTKMSGAGNDFVLIEKRGLKGLPRPSELARRLCDRRGCIGADGLLIVDRSKSRSPSVDYYNADGTRAFCANGSRCAAWWMYHQGRVGRSFILDTIQGGLQAHVADGRRSILEGRVRLQMPDVTDVRLNLSLRAEGRSWRVHALNTGVPHVVVEAKNLERLDVFWIGRVLRRHTAFGRAGANVDFLQFPWSKNRKPTLHIRTYERGVEDETLACGTGAVASAVCAHLLRGTNPPVDVRVRSGDTLTASFRRSGDRMKDVWLEGPAKITFQGEICL